MRVERHERTEAAARLAGLARVRGESQTHCLALWHSLHAARDRASLATFPGCLPPGVRAALNSLAEPVPLIWSNSW